MKKLSIGDVSKMMSSVVSAEDESSIEDVIRRLRDSENSSEETARSLFEESKRINESRNFLVNFVPFLIVSAIMLLISLVFKAVGIFRLNFCFPYIAIDLICLIIGVEGLVIEIEGAIDDRRVIDSLHSNIIIGNVALYAMYKKNLTPLHQVSIS